MKLTSIKNEETNTVTVTLIMFGQEISHAPLDEFDRALLVDCDSPDATIADKLLALECLARRIEQEEAGAETRALPLAKVRQPKGENHG